jgi:hypothetical protein
MAQVASTERVDRAGRLWYRVELVERQIQDAPGSPHPSAGTSRGSLLFRRLSFRAAIGSWSLFAAGALGLIYFWRGPIEPRNLARGATVEMSSNCGQPPQYSLSQVGPELLVDGRLDRAYDACTKLEAEPWVRLDLRSSVSVQEIAIYGRADCCWARHTLPLVLEGSEDNQHYREIARRALPFTKSNPWVVRTNADRVRYVRLRVASDRTAHIVLSEIQVLGQRR